MRIVHVSTVQSHPCFSDIIVRQLQNHDVICVVLEACDNPGYTFTRKYRGEDGVVYRHMSVGKDLDFSPDPALEAAFDGLIDEFKPDVIHIQLFAGVNVRSIFRAYTKKTVKKVITLHTHSLYCLPGICFDKDQICPLNSMDECGCDGCRTAAGGGNLPLGTYNRIREDRLKEIMSLSDAVICCSHWQKETIRRLTGEDRKTVTLYYSTKIEREHDTKLTLTRAEAEDRGIDWENLVRKATRRGWGKKTNDETFSMKPVDNSQYRRIQEVFGDEVHKIRSALKLPLKSARKKSRLPVFGYLGTLWELKGINILLDAVNLTENLEFEILMGIKFDKTNTRDRAVLSRIRECCRTRVITNLQREDFYEKFFSQIDYLVIPSMWEETGPMTLFEAFYYKTPVIVSRCPSMTEKIREGVNAFVFDDAAALSGIMKDIIEGRIQPPKKLRTNFPVKTPRQYARILDRIYSAKSDELFLLSETART